MKQDFSIWGKFYSVEDQVFRGHSQEGLVGLHHLEPHFFLEGPKSNNNIVFLRKPLKLSSSFYPSPHTIVKIGSSYLGPREPRYPLTTIRTRKALLTGNENKEMYIIKFTTFITRLLLFYMKVQHHTKQEMVRRVWVSCKGFVWNPRLC